MMEVTLFVLAIFACSVHSLQDNFQKEKKLFHAFLEEIYGNGYEMESFVDLMWPEIQRIVPETLKVPAVEIYNVNTDSYICGTECVAHARLGKLLSKKLLLRSKEKFTFEVEAEFFAGADKPVEVGIAKKLAFDKASPTVHVSFAFKDPFKVKIILEIANFLGQRSVLTPMCVMKVKNMMVVGLSEAQLASPITDPLQGRIVTEYEERFSSVVGGEVLATVSLVQAVDDRLNAAASFWVCPSRFLDKVVDGYKKEWEYTANYYKYCLKKDVF